MMQQGRGFILSRHQQDVGQGIELRYWVWQPEGTHCLHITEQEAVFFIPQAKQAEAELALQPLQGWRIEPLALTDLNYQPVAGVYSTTLRTYRQAIERLQQAAIPMMEEDIRPVDRYLMERFIFGGVAFMQSPQGWRLKPASITPHLSLLSIDIETNMRADCIHSIGLAGNGLNRVLMRGEGVDDDRVRYCADERRLLQAFVAEIQGNDPDILVGWSVIGFDFRVLAARADALQVPLVIGRDKQALQVQQSELGKWYVRLEGRVIIDGIDTLKGATYHFESYALEYVSQQLFGRGKLIHQPNDRGAEIQRLYREDKAALARYNLMDCQLVLDIFEHTQLLPYLIERTRLTGLALDKVGGSAAAFDFQYLPRLHRAGFVAPEYASGDRGFSVPGGYVMESLPGLYQHVLVLDFKSLYPSIIRTFKIDPAGLAVGVAEKGDPKQLIPGFNGAIFAADQAILPTIIEELWAARDQAKLQKAQALSQAIKIIMNSFYGVLGSDVCRFFDQRLSGSITLRGHQILQQTRDEIERQFGYQVIYGDTDSVFVLLGDDETDDSADAKGQALAAYLNTWWTDQVKHRFGTESYLELEYETHFSRFLMPRMRHSEKGTKKRYAGLKRLPQGGQKMVFKGLENVRSDWTPLARDLQNHLYEAIFTDQPYHTYLQTLVEEVRAGLHDDALVYRRRLRRPLAAYQRVKPPHVQAALKGQQYWEARQRPSPYEPGAHVSYVMTVNGAEPVEARHSPIDYEHYIEKQMLPVVDAILCFKDETFQQIISAQPDLFSEV